MTDRRDLHGYVRLDGSGRSVPNSLVLRKNKPKVGRWVEVEVYQCCNGTTTTTTSDSINNPPNKPSNPDPADGATKASGEVMLSWDCSDPNNGDNVTYDVYLGFVGNVKFYTTTSNALCAVRDLKAFYYI